MARTSPATTARSRSSIAFSDEAGRGQSWQRKQFQIGGSNIAQAVVAAGNHLPLGRDKYKETGSIPWPRPNNTPARGHPKRYSHSNVPRCRPRNRVDPAGSARVPPVGVRLCPERNRRLSRAHDSQRKRDCALSPTLQCFIRLTKLKYYAQLGADPNFR